MKKRCLGVLLALLITLAQMPTALASLYGVATGETIRKQAETQEGKNTISAEFRENPDSGQKQRTAKQTFTVKGPNAGAKPSDSGAGATTETASGTCGDNLTWTLKGSTLTISGSGYMTSFPSTTDMPWYDNRANITTVVIENGVTDIGGNAFYDCSNLSSVTIPDSVRAIWSDAFYGCSSLSSVTIPNSVTMIWIGAFRSCNSLSSVSIPSSVTEIRYNPFPYCSGLINIDVASENREYISESGILFNRSKTTLIGYPAGKTETSYSIPNSVTSIGFSAFAGCRNLSSVTISNNVISLADMAFASCSALKSVSIPAGITNIGESAFDYCENLTDIYYDGDEAQWNAITIGAYNDALASATIHYGTEGQTSQNNAVQSNRYVSGQFTDVPADSWCADYVKVAYEKGIMNGKTDDYFDVTGSLTVAQAIVMASRLHSGYNGIDGNFHSAKPWYQSYLDYALAHGIVTSVREDYNIPATRAEYAAILGKALPASALAEISSIEVGAIPDVSPDSEHYDAIYQLYRAGVLTGNDAKGTFAPDSNISRGAAAAIISRMAEPSLRKSITLEAAPFEPVPMKELANLQSLRKKCTDAELKEAYDIAVQLVEPFAKLSREEQLQGIMKTLREYFENGMTYSTSAPHYNDPYGYLVLKTASCAGCTRTTGLCLNILGIPYEHENPDSWTHQWCRVDVNGTYWICDAYGLYCGPEPAPHTHPRLS